MAVCSAVRNDEKQCSVRIGAVVYYSIGQLFTHQLLTGRFHTRDYIYPVGYRCVRFFWSIRQPNTRFVSFHIIGKCKCIYECVYVYIKIKCLTDAMISLLKANLSILKIMNSRFCNLVILLTCNTHVQYFNSYL